MLINWFTVLAQIVNFLILIYLLKRFLFKPILRAMAEREKNMAEVLNRAEQAEQKAEKKARELEEAKKAFALDRETLMAEARDQVAQWRENTLKAAKDEVETLRGAWMANMTRDREAFLDDLKHRLVEQVVQIGGKVVRDLADQGLNRQVLQVFLEKVAHGKDELTRHGLNGDIWFSRAFPLKKVMHKTFENGFPSGFRVEPAFIWSRRRNWVWAFKCWSETARWHGIWPTIFGIWKRRSWETCLKRPC